MRPFGNPIIQIFFRRFQPLVYETNDKNLYMTHDNINMPLEGIGSPYEVTTPIV